MHFLGSKKKSWFITTPQSFEPNVEWCVVGIIFLQMKTVREKVLGIAVKW